MTLALRLQRHGRKNRPFYHIVAADIRNPRDGRFKEKLGYYNPTCEPSVIEIDSDRLQYHYGNGARISNTVKNLARIKKIPLTRGQQQPTQPTMQELVEEPASNAPTEEQVTTPTEQQT